MSISKYVLYLSTSLIASVFICGVNVKRAEAFGLHKHYEPSSDALFTRIYPPDLYDKTSISQPNLIDECGLFGGRSCYEVELPNHLEELIIQAITQESGLAPIGFQVTRAQHITWSNGCMENYQPGMICSMVVLPEWRVIAEDSNFRWQYRIVSSSVSRISEERINVTIPSDSAANPTQPVPEPASVLGSLGALAVGGGLRKMLRKNQ